MSIDDSSQQLLVYSILVTVSEDHASPCSEIIF